MNSEQARWILKFHRPDRPRNTERRQLQKAIDVILGEETRPQGDLISRETLKEVINDLFKTGEYDCNSVLKAINNTPTVELDESVIQEVLNKRCMTAVANEYLVTLHGERPQGDLISRKDLKLAIREMPDWCGDDTYYSGVNDVSRLIDNAPTVPQVTVFTENADEKAVADLKAELQNVLEARQKGEWIYHDKLNKYFCKDCGLIEPFTKEEIEEGIKLPNFCSNCGADMR